MIGQVRCTIELLTPIKYGKNYTLSSLLLGLLIHFPIEERTNIIQAHISPMPLHFHANYYYVAIASSMPSSWFFYNANTDSKNSSVKAHFFPPFTTAKTHLNARRKEEKREQLKVIGDDPENSISLGPCRRQRGAGSVSGRGTHTGQ